MFNNSIGKDGLIWLGQISKLVDDILAKKKPMLEIETIDKYLSRCMKGKSFEVVLVKDAKKPFIMSVYPNYEQLQRRLPTLVNVLNDVKSDELDFTKAWGEQDKWYVEIDANLFNPISKLRVTHGDEFVGILCHEMGHVMNTNPMMLAIAYKRKRLALSKFKKTMSARNNIVRQFMMVALLNTLQFKIVVFGKLNNAIEEIKADLMVPKEYEGALVTYIQHSILDNPDLNGEIIIDDSDMANHIDNGLTFSTDVIELMKIRKHVLVNHIKFQNSITHSPYIRNVMKNLLRNMSGAKMESEDTDIVRENMINREFNTSYNYCLEMTSQELERTRVSERDIYLLQMDVDNIRDRIDKSYAINTIFDYIEIIEKENYNKIKRMDGKVPEFIKNDKRLVTLHQLKTKAVNVRVVDDTRFGVNIKYPSGYEG